MTQPQDILLELSWIKVCDLHVVYLDLMVTLRTFVWTMGPGSAVTVAAGEDQSQRTEEPRGRSSCGLGRALIKGPDLHRWMAIGSSSWSATWSATSFGPSSGATSFGPLHHGAQLRLDQLQGQLRSDELQGDEMAPDLHHGAQLRSDQLQGQLRSDQLKGYEMAPLRL